MTSPRQQELLYKELKEKLASMICINPECSNINNPGKTREMFKLSYRGNKTHFQIRENIVCCDLFTAILKKTADNIHKNIMKA